VTKNEIITATKNLNLPKLELSVNGKVLKPDVTIS
jgi:hypothetical protein